MTSRRWPSWWATMAGSAVSLLASPPSAAGPPPSAAPASGDPASGAPASAPPASAPPASAPSDAGDAPSADASSGTPRPLPVLTSVVPGVIVHGMGNFVAGRSEAGLRIALVQLVGTFLATTGSVTLAVTGASRALAGPAAAASVTGAGLLVFGWLTDVASVSTPDGGTGAADVDPPITTTEVGYRFVDDPQFAYHHLLVESVELRLGHFLLRPSGTFALDDRNAQLRMLGAYRLYGPLPSGPPSRDGTSVDVGVAATHHAYYSDGFRTLTAEAFADFRLDSERLHESLAGTFGEVGTGVALAAAELDAPGYAFGDDVDALLLGRFAFGLYVAGPSPPSAEVSVFYDHRHDGYVGGLTGFGVGLPGHFGVGTRVRLSSAWGLSADLRRGAATVAGLSVLYHVSDAR